jgi:hypothetical protein
MSDNIVFFLSFTWVLCQWVQGRCLIVSIVELNKGYGVFDFAALCDCFIWL